MPPATTSPQHYTVFYDAHCRLCARSRRTLERLRPRAQMVFVNVRDDAAMGQFPEVDRAASLGQMFVRDPAGRIAGGYDAFLSLTPALPVAAGVRTLLAWGPVRSVGWRLYRWIARNRYRLGGAVNCDGGACEL